MAHALCNRLSGEEASLFPMNLKWLELIIAFKNKLLKNNLYICILSAKPQGELLHYLS